MERSSLERVLCQFVTKIRPLAIIVSVQCLSMHRIVPRVMANVSRYGRLERVKTRRWPRGSPM